jgi:hypothetical protein
MSGLFPMLAGVLAFAGGAAAQQGSVVRDVLNGYDSIQYFRYYDQRGINVFETPKNKVQYQGFKIRFGAGFTQQYQSLKHENRLATGYQGANKLYALQSGFMTAQANLYTDVQLADGIRLNLTTYLSARHHNEAWVKGGFIQMDRFPFRGRFWDRLAEVATVKVGHFEVNYGDAHFRRPDGGHTLYSPFMEQNIMDAFATEIGGEFYLQQNGFFGMVGVTNGMIKGHVDSTYPTAADPDVKRNPSLLLKGGFDRQVAERLRLRVTGSLYTNGSSAGSGLTLYSGDRTGSNYQNVMEKVPYGTAVPAYTAMYTSGRFNPGFSKKVTAAVLNVFAKAGGFEVFGTLEQARGRTKTESTDRTFKQFAVEGVYRLGREENLFVGARYNTVAGRPAGSSFTTDITVRRTALAAGWFVTRNVLAKMELVRQEYRDFPLVDHRAGGSFDGLVVEAVVGF